MATIKNRIYCNQCQKSKFLFESEAKANNFLKFNHEAIKERNGNGKAPIKSYYCTSCCGWHVTSKGYETTEFNIEPIADSASLEKKRKKELKYQEEREKEAEIKELYSRVEKELDSIEPLIQNLEFEKAKMKLLYLKNSEMPKYAQVYICNNKRFVINNRIESYLVILECYVEKFSDCIEADRLIIKLENDMDVAETLMDIGDFADAKVKNIYINDILKLLKDKIIYKEERDALQIRVESLFTQLTRQQFKEKPVLDRILTLEQLIKNQELIPTLTIKEADEDNALELVQFQMEMAYETEKVVLDFDDVEDGVMGVLCDKDKGTYIIAKKSNVIVGCLMLTKEWSDWNNSWYLWIQSVYVKPNYRRQGVYSFMYSKVKDIARKMGSHAIRLYVDSNNKSAQQVYVNLGMKESHYLLFEEEL